MGNLLRDEGEPAAAADAAPIVFGIGLLSEKCWKREGAVVVMARDGVILSRVLSCKTTGSCSFLRDRGTRVQLERA
jgi:hypothetical protein